MSDKYLTLTGDNFDQHVLQSDKPVLVDFWADWCGPCRAIAPTIEQLASETEGQALVGKVNVDAHPDLASRYGVTSIPSLLFFQGGELKGQIVGGAPKKVLAEKLLSL